MSEESGYIDAVRNARESQRKYDYFLMGITLALLSLSLQAFKSSADTSFSYLIIIHWILLLVSFLAGMVRQEKINTIQIVEADLIPEQHLLDLFKQSRDRAQPMAKNATGELWTPDEVAKVIENKEQMLKIGDKIQKKSGKIGVIAYRIQKWLFVLGLAAYMLLKILNIYIPKMASSIKPDLLL